MWQALCFVQVEKYVKNFVFGGWVVGWYSVVGWCWVVRWLGGVQWSHGVWQSGGIQSCVQV